MLSKIRQPFSGLSHLAGALTAVIGVIFLLARSGDSPTQRISLIVYGASLFMLFFASGIYHTVCADPRVIAVLRKFDHAAIYLLIAGSYTPFCLNAFTGFWRWGFLAIIWGLAILGIVMKIWFIHAPRWVTAGVYIIMGWLSVFAFREMLSTLPVSSMIWLFIGGITYTLGAVIYITKRMDFVPGVFGFHEVWHIFVLLGAAAHFVAIYNLVQPMLG